MSILAVNARLSTLEKRHPNKPDFSELDQIIAESIAEWNSPEAKAEREQRYQELQIIAERRAAAYKAGLDMDAVAPLPEWVTRKPSEEEIEELKSLIGR